MITKIDNIEYTVSVIPPYLQPYITLYGDLAQKETKDFEDAKHIEGQMRNIVEKILEETVSPKPPKEHQFELYRIINNLTSNAMGRVDKFFPPFPFLQANKKAKRMAKPLTASKTK